MTKICTNCGNEFDAKRETARFCSDKCKKAHSRVSGTNEEVSGTNISGTQPNGTLKEDSETRLWLIEQFKAEGKPPDEIRDIMIAQDSYYRGYAHYFIPTRMLPSRQRELIND